MIKHNFDVIIIGAGICGCLCARELSRYKLDILLIDKEIDVGMGASSANSAILHSGHDPRPGSLKAQMNRQGNRLWKEIAPQLSIPLKNCGAFIVAIGNEEKEALCELKERADHNKIEGVRILDAALLRQRFPFLNPDVSGALETPTAAVIDPFKAVWAAAESAVKNGVTFLAECEFKNFILSDKKIKGIQSSKGDFFAKQTINMAGVFADDLMHKAGIRPEFKITPRLGEYFVFAPQTLPLDSVLFPVPNKYSKGCLVTTTCHGNVMIGPNAVEVEEKDDTATSSQGNREILEKAKRLVPSLRRGDIIAQFAGIRATGNANKDFLIEVATEIEGLINAAGIESPGFVSAPAIACRVAELLEQSGLTLQKKSSWDPCWNAPPVFRDLSREERIELIARDKHYARIICRCETVTEGEVLAAMRCQVPARSYDGIKRRTWLGTGRCQGGFDYPRVIELMQQELNLTFDQITKRGGKSRVIFRKSKDVDCQG